MQLLQFVTQNTKKYSRNNKEGRHFSSSYSGKPKFVTEDMVKEGAVCY